MPSLPIALGEMTVSSEKVAGPSPHETNDFNNDDDEDDETIDHGTSLSSSSSSSSLVPVDLYQTVAFAVCPRKEWLARVFASYYDVMKKNQGDYNESSKSSRKRTVVEVRIRISRLCHPSLATRYRETTYHLKLSEDTASGLENEDSAPRQMRPHVAFSEDRKNLAVLLFHPHVDTSSVAIFQLRRPRSHASAGSTHDIPRPLPTPPAYVLDTNDSGAYGSTGSSSNNNNNNNNNNAPNLDNSSMASWKMAVRAQNLGETPAVSTNFRLLSGVWGDVMALCRVPVTQAGTRPVFVCVCHDLSLVWVDGRSGQAVARGLVPWPKKERDRLPMMIRSVQAAPDSTLAKGSLVLVASSVASKAIYASNDHGECALVQWELESTTPVQQTFLKRASTGTVTMIPPVSVTRSLDDLDLDSLPQGHDRSQQQRVKRRGSERHRIAPRRTVSTGTAPGLRRTFHRHMNNLLLSPTQAIQEQKEKLQRHLQRQQEQLRHHQQQYMRRLTNNDNGNGIRSNSFTALQQNMLGDMLLSAVSPSSQSSPAKTRIGGSNGRTPRESNTRDTRQKPPPQQHQQRRQVPSRSNSTASSASSLLEGLNAALEGIHRRNSSSGRNDRIKLRKEEMQQYALRELQKRSRSGSLLEEEQHRELLSDTVAGELAVDTSHLTKNGHEKGTHNPSSPTKRRYPRRWSNPDKNGDVKKMQVEFVSSWSAESEGPSKQTVVDAIFGSVSSVVCILLQSQKTERRQRIAQVCTIDEAGAFVPTVSLSLSLEHVEQSIHANRSARSSQGRTNDNKGVLAGTSLQSRHGLDYDPSFDCFVVSAIYGDEKYWVGCVWNWRSNSLGWTMHGNCAKSLWSRLIFAWDMRRGYHLVHLETRSLDIGEKSSCVETRTKLVKAGILSPPNAMAGCILSEPCSLLLSGDYLAFPNTKRVRADSTSLELEWKVSSLPVSYVAACGPPRIAAVGAMKCKSLAVAATHGVCVLDARRPSNHRWKQFGSPSEERAFSVVAMTWWEGSRFGNSDVEMDDLLIAIVEDKCGQQFISCWSPKRLDSMNQLFETPDPGWKNGESQDPDPPWGLALPSQFKATHLSLLAEPRKEVVTNDKPRRAVLLLYALDHDQLEFDYLVFRLQSFRPKRPNNLSADTYRRTYVVFAQEKLQGRVQNGARSVGPIQSIFLSGAWFRFDLRQFARKTKAATIDDEDFVTTLGVVRYGGMEVVCLADIGKGWIARLTTKEVSRVWLTDIVHLKDDPDLESPPIATFAWAFELMNGDLYCWSVPSVLTVNSGQFDDWKMAAAFRETNTQRPRGLCPPSLACTKATRAQKKRWLLGTLCELGTASDWMQHSSSGSKFHIEMGQVPNSLFGCVLRAGQSTRRFAGGKLNETTTNGIRSASDLFSNFEPTADVYSQSSFLMSPPAFVLSLHAMLLEAASLKMDIPTHTTTDATSSTQEVESRRLQEINRHVHERLASAPNRDAVMMALRILILRSVEAVSSSHKMHSREPSGGSESNVRMATALFSGIVDAVRGCTSNLQFASLFLEVGRQVEPSSLEHLYPLPLPSRAGSTMSKPVVMFQNVDGHMLDKTSARTVADLFTLCVEERSLAASTAALPLFATKSQALQHSRMLLDEAIHTFVRNTRTDECKFDASDEERRVIGDIFRFAIKLEDSETMDEGERARQTGEAGQMHEARISISEGSESDDKGRYNLICRSGTFLHYIVPSSFVGESEKEKEEEAIKKEASTFIKNSLDDPALGFSTLPADWDDLSTPLSDINSVAGLVGDALVDLLQSTDTENNWSAMAGLAEMMVPDMPIPSSYALLGQVAKKALPLDILSILPESYDVNEGSETCLSAYLETEIAKCRAQVARSTSAINIVSLALLVLDRAEALPLPDVADQTVMELGLIIIIMVAGQNCGRSKTILESLDAECLMGMSYEAVVVGQGQ